MGGNASSIANSFVRVKRPISYKRSLMDEPIGMDPLDKRTTALDPGEHNGGGIIGVVCRVLQRTGVRSVFRVSNS